MKIDSTVLEAFGLGGGTPARLESGLINASWRVDTPAGKSFVLQRVNPMFPASVNRDIDAVTRHLRARGMPTPLIVPTRDGDPALVRAGEVWRVLTFVPGVSRDTLQNSRQADQAGALLGRFHHALGDLEHGFSKPRIGVHDTASHLARLGRALGSHANHPQFGRVGPLGERILDMARGIPDLPLDCERVVHGDPKISNVIFDPGTDDAICLVDLDTVAAMPVILELGDALRSWCNPRGEDTRETTLSVPLFRAALRGYSRGVPGLLSDDQWRALPGAMLTICIELAARFAADALLETYFGWDATRFDSASTHNQVRAAGQLHLAEQVLSERKSLQCAVDECVE